MKNNKGFVAVGVAIAIVLALGLISFGVYKVFNKDVPATEDQNAPIDNFPSDYKPADHGSVSTDASDWKVYSNAKYGISFSFPKEWGNVIEQDEGNDIPTIRIAEKDQCNNSFDPKCNTSSEVLIVTVKGYTLNSLVTTLQKNNQAYTKVTVNGFPAIFYTFVEGRKSQISDPEPFGYYKGVTASLVKPDGTYITVAFSSPLYKSEIEAKAYNTSDFEKFLSIVKFSTPFATDTSNWKIYKNARYGYEITFTDSWKDHKVVENADGSVDFKVRASNDEYWRLYSIVPVDANKWDHDVEACGKMSPEEQDSPTCGFISWKIAQNDKYVFMTTTAQDFSHEMDSAHSDFLQKIVPTFKFTK